MILAARFTGTPMAEIILRVEGWAAGGAIEGVGDVTRAAIIRQLAGIEPHQVAAFTDLLLSRVERAVIVDTAQEFNLDVRYEYFGPLYNLTRDFCLDTLTDPRQNEGWTAAEIEGLSNGQTGSAMTDGGGYNCRHQFIPIVSDQDVRDAFSDVQIAESVTAVIG